jgi:hypothetical protein
LLQNSTPFHDTNSEETRNKRNVPQHKKGYTYQTLTHTK